MPKRQFIGHHPVVDKKIVLIIREDIDDFIRAFNQTKIPRGD
jgi:hypothetical protein